MRPRKSVLAGALEARQLIATLGLTNLPIDPFQIAARYEIVCFKGTDKGAGISGCLMKQGDNFGIYYNGTITSIGFQRFTVAHELGHYFVPGHIALLFADGNTIHESRAGFRSDELHEREADEFAANLLMPENLFKAECDRLGEGLTAIEALAAACGTSLTATARRYAELTEGLAAIILSEQNRIHFSRMSTSLQSLAGISSDLIQKNSGLPQNSATARFNRDSKNIETNNRVSAQTSADVWLGSNCSLMLTEDVIGLGSYGRTLTVIWADGNQNPDEEDAEQNEEDILPSQRWRDRY